MAYNLERLAEGSTTEAEWSLLSWLALKLSIIDSLSTIEEFPKRIGKKIVNPKSCKLNNSKQTKIKNIDLLFESIENE